MCIIWFDKPSYITRLIIKNKALLLLPFLLPESPSRLVISWGEVLVLFIFEHSVLSTMHMGPLYMWAFGGEGFKSTLIIEHDILLRKKYALNLQFWSPHKEDGFKKMERGTNGESSINIYTLLCVNGQLKGSTAQWAQSGPLWWPRCWDGSRGGRRHREGVYV